MTITIVKGVTADDSVAAANITGVVPVHHGGTGAATLTGILLGNGTHAVTAITTSAGISGAISDETGSGALVFANTPTLIAPLLGTPTSGVMTNVTGTAAGLTAGNATLAATATVATNLFNTTAVTVTDTTGRVTFPAQPFFFAYPSADLANQTGDGTDYVVACNSTLSNVGSYYNTSTFTFTAPVTGIYQFIGSINATISIAHNLTLMRIFVNGVGWRVFEQNLGPSSSNPVTSNASITIAMTATQTATLNILVSGGTKTVNIEGTASGFTFFSGRLVG